MSEIEKVVIVGSGPAGHTAALYAARANLSPLMFEGQFAGGIPGGQLMITTEVENYPGFPKGIQGPDLMQAFREQSLRFEARIFTEDVTAVDFSKQPFTVGSSERSVQTHAVIIATGATARRLRLPSEERLWNRGISACAVCDGALPIFRNKVLIVIGGGDSAVEESTYLSKFASKVYLIHRRDTLRASKIMQQRLFDNPKIEVVWNSLPVDVLGEQMVTGVRLEDVVSHRQRDLACGGLFYAIGHEPNVAVFRGQIELAPDGYVITAPGTTKTSVEGVFACGDVQDRYYRQAITAAGSGCMAALDCERWLAARGVH